MQKMKKIIIVTVLSLGVLFSSGNNIFAQEDRTGASQSTFVPINQVLEKPLPVVSGNKVFDVILTRADITDTSIIVYGQVKREDNRIGSSRLIFGHNDTPEISLDPENRGNDKGDILVPVLFSETFVTMSTGHAPKDFLSTQLNVTGLQPGTTYYFQIKDNLSIPNTTYKTVSYTTTGVKPPDVGTANIPEPVKPLSTQDQKRAITVTISQPQIKQNESSGLYDVTFLGKLMSSHTLQSVGLKLLFGDSPGSLIDGDIAFPAQRIEKGSEYKIEYSLANFNMGKVYYYKFVDTNTDRNYQTDLYQFEILGNTTEIPTTQPVITPEIPIPPTGTYDVYDPDADTGMFIDNYQLPTNIGEPAGDAGAPVQDPGTLVPCGKKSDRGDAQYCRFNHLLILFANIIDYMLVLIAPLVVLVSIYTGTQMIIHRKVPADLVRYKENFQRIGIGVAVMLLAWTIIATLLKTLVGPDASRFILLDIL